MLSILEKSVGSWLSYLKLGITQENPSQIEESLFVPISGVIPTVFISLAKIKLYLYQ